MTPYVPAGNVWRFYYYAGSTRIAMRIRDNTSEPLFFLFADQLGSTNVVSDPNGLLVSLSLHMPWGETGEGRDRR
jgi:hypothetical protein